MEDINKNKFEVNVGYVVEDKEYNSVLLKVYVPEFLPYSIANDDNTIKQKIKISDALRDNLEKELELNDSNMIVATYIDLFSNRSDPPDVRQGEQVLIVQYRDTDVYYWFSFGRDDNLRRLEHFKIAVSDDTTIQKELNEDNTYFLEMDTLHKKSVRIRTSNSDGEEYRYLIQIDSIANTVTVNDDSGNEIFLDSNVPRIKIANRSNAFVDVNNVDVILGAPRDIIINAGRQLLITAPSMTTAIDGTIATTFNTKVDAGIHKTTHVATSGGDLGSTTDSGPSRFVGGNRYDSDGYGSGAVSVATGSSVTTNPTPASVPTAWR